MPLENVKETHMFSISPFYKINEIIIIFMTIFIPLAFCIFLVNMFNTCKILIFELGTLFCVGFWLADSIKKERVQISSTELNLPLLCFLFVALCSIAWSDSPIASLVSLPYFLAGPLLFLVITNTIKSKTQIYRIAAIAIAVGTLLAIYGIFQYYGIDFSFWTGNVGRQQVFALFGNVNYFAEFLIMPLLVASVLLFSPSIPKKIKLLLTASVLLMGFALLVTFTRSAYLGFAASFLLVFLLYWFWEKRTVSGRHKRIALLTVLLTVTALLIVFIPNPLNGQGTTIGILKTRVSLTRLAQDSSLIRRLTIWKFTTLMIKEHPLLGTGVGTYAYNSLRYQAKFFAQGDNRSLYPYGIAAQAHNEYLQIWAELGIAGLLTFLWIMVRYFRSLSGYLSRAKKNKEPFPALLIALMAAVIGILVDSCFGFPLQLPASLFLFWLTLGISMVFLKQQSFAQTKDRTVLERAKNKPALNTTLENSVYKNNIVPKKLKYIFYILLAIVTLAASITVARPVIAEIYEFRALKYLEKEDFDNALAQYNSVLKWNPFLGRAYFNVGQIMEQKGLFPIASEYFERVAQYFDHPYLPKKLAYLYLQMGLEERALPKFEQAITYEKYHKDTLPLYSEMGKIYLDKKESHNAERAFRQMQAIDEENIYSYFGLSLALINQNRGEEAMATLQRLIALAPDSIEAKQAEPLLQHLTRKKKN